MQYTVSVVFLSAAFDWMLSACKLYNRSQTLKFLSVQSSKLSIFLFSTYHFEPNIKLSSSVAQSFLSRLRNVKLPPYSSSGKLFQLKQIHAQIITQGLPIHKLFPFCIASGNVNYARVAFDRAQILCKFDRNAMLQAYSKSAVPEKAVLLFREMLEIDGANTGPDNYSFTFLIAACSRLHPRCNCHSMVIKRGHESDGFVRNSLVNMYAVFGAMGDAITLFDEMSERGDIVSWTTMIGGYMRIGMVDLALELFDRMPERNDVSWGVVIAGYVHNGRYKSALNAFNDMLRCLNVKPNEAILVCALSACAQLGALDQGKWIHVYAEKNGIVLSSNLATSLIDMYVKCGSISRACRVFECVSSRKDVLSWTAMIYGLALHGLGEEAVELFSGMVVLGMRPDHITLIGVLNACSHSGLVNHGRKTFQDMHRLWGIMPAIEHYGCMVDLLGRAGCLKEALQVAKSMHVEPDIVIWRSLLSSCRIHGNVVLAEEVVCHIQQCDLSDSGGSHVLLSSMYASSNCWDRVSRVRNSMHEKRIGLPGWSSIEVEGAVHEFTAGDKSHARTEAIYQKLDEVFRRIRSVGYLHSTMRTSFELSEEDKEQALYWHSEKVAVAFGLLSTEAGLPIRIVKNLRICEDCHSAMKAISCVFDREIIVRDRSRFHNFKQGSCSCRDFW